MYKRISFVFKHDSTYFETAVLGQNADVKTPAPLL